MNRSRIRAAAATLAATALTLAFLAVPASAPSQAATFSFSDPNCASFSLTGGSGNYTLACASLNCVIGSSAGLNISPVAGSATLLTATCVPAADTNGYTWTAAGGNVAGCPPPVASTINTMQLAAASAVAANCVYQVAATSAANGSGQASITLSYANTIVAPAGCNINWPTGSQSSPFNYNLTVSCSTPGTSPVTYNWTSAPGVTGGSTASASISGTITSTGTFTVQVSNSADSSNPVVVSGQINIGGGGGGINCSAQGFANTTVVNENWASPTTNVVAAMGVNDAVVVKFTTGSKTSSSGNNRIVAGEYQTTPTNRRAVLSTTACDFGAGLGQSAITNGSSIIQYFSVGLPDSSGDPMLQPNTTYYINIQNVQPPACGNTGGVCNMFVSLYKAGGL